MKRAIGLGVALVVSAVLAVSLFGCSAGAAPVFTVVSRDGHATRDDMAPVINAVQLDSANFAGVWWDAGAPLPLHAAYVNDDPAVRAGVEQWLPPGGSIAWHRVRYSYGELETIQGEVLAWANRTGLFNSSGTDVIRNRVSVSIQQHDVPFETDLMARYPDGIEFEVGPAPQPL